MTASGRFAVARDDGSSGMLFGWFNKDSRGWRTPNSLAFRIDGNGEMVFVLDGKRHALPLTQGHKADGAEFNRFGMFNQMITGGGMEVYFDDLVIDGKAQDLGRDPGWEARGSQATFNERAFRPRHDFGYSKTRFAGGPGTRRKERSEAMGGGEVGGILWRDEEPAYYADRVGPLSLDDELFASGKLAFTHAGSDSGVYIGWFDAASKRNKTTRLCLSG